MAEGGNKNLDALFDSLFPPTSLRKSDAKSTSKKSVSNNGPTSKCSETIASADKRPAEEDNDDRIAGIEGRSAGGGSDEASGSMTNYILVDDEEKLGACLQQIRESIGLEPLLALDCEGEKLSRKGKLLLLSVATRQKAFLIDVLALQSRPFEAGFRAILEDNAIKKLVFDCRNDADALQHQFNVKLNGVIDIQLLEVIKRPPDASANNKSKRRSERHDEVVRVRAHAWCVENILADKDMLAQKKEGANLMDDWGKRPLQKKQLDYAKTDVLSLFKLFEALRPDGEEQKQLEIASDRYVDLKRSIVNRTYNQYEDHGYLPIDVIPAKGRNGFDYAYIACVECKRCFPADEFSKTQLRTHVQKCRTCKKVKLDNDVRVNRIQNIERDWDRDDCFDYYSDSDYGCGYDSDRYDDYSDNFFGYDSDW